MEQSDNGVTPMKRGRVFVGEWEPLMIKIDPALKSALNDIARYRRDSMSGIVRELIRGFVEDNRVAAASGFVDRLERTI